jgi:hypothetical protein
VTVVHIKILSHIVIAILCTVLVFQSTVVVSLIVYSVYIQPVGTTAAASTSVAGTVELPIVVKGLVDNGIQEFQNNNINSTITYLKAAEQELLSSLAIVGNNKNYDNNSDNNSADVRTPIIQPLTISFLLKSTIQSLDGGDCKNGRKYLNLAEQEFGRNILDVSSSLNPQTIMGTSNTTLNNNNNNSYFSTYTNTKYGIKLQYPHNWVIEADDYPTGGAGSAGIQITSFYLPDVNNGLPFFRIGTNDLTKEFPSLQKMSVNQYLQRSLAHKNSTGFPGFNLIESGIKNSQLAGNLAYTVIWTYTNPYYGDRKSVEIATIIGNRGYFVDYTAGTAAFSKYLPIAEKMIESFQKTK